MTDLSPRQLHRLVNRYIGVNGGYLGDFSYRTHAEFYMDLDIDIDPNAIPGTTRERFITILNGSPPDAQAKIIRGILTRYPADSREERTQELHDELGDLASQLEGRADPRPSAPDVGDTPLAVRRALRDAEHLLESSGASSALDRVHTALHGYLRQVCREAGISFEEGTSASALLTRLVTSPDGLPDLGVRAEETRRVLRTLGATVDALGTQRNLASLAHANDELLGEPEAVLAINAAYALITYLESKRRRSARG